MTTTVGRIRRALSRTFAGGLLIAFVDHAGRLDRLCGSELSPPGSRTRTRMSEPALITFVDDYDSDDQSIEGAARALERAEPVAIRWPSRTAELLARKEAEDTSGAHHHGVSLDEARRFAAASSRLPHFWRALNATGASATQAFFALAMFARFANLHVLRRLAQIQFRGESPILEEELRVHELNMLYNSSPGHRALGSDLPIYTVDVEVERPGEGRYYFAPGTLIVDLRVGDKARGELLICWIIPQSEVHLLGKETDFDYRDLTIWHVRDDEWGEDDDFKHNGRLKR
jgi:hypothetical protein